MPNGTVELTPEAIEEYIAAQQALLSPVEPPAIAPEMQFVTGQTEPAPRLAPAPVPLPMRVPQRFRATSASPVFDPLEQIREQVNATHFKTAQEALNASIKFQAMRAFQRDIDAGRKPEEALLKWGPMVFSQPSVLPGMLREQRLAAPPRVFQGSNVPPAVVYGGRATFPPVSSLPRPPLTSEVTEHLLPGSTNVFARSIPTGPQSRRVFATMERTLSPSQTASVLGANIRTAENELKGLPTLIAGVIADESITDKAAREADRKKRFDAAQERREALKSDIDGWRERLKEMLPRAPAKPAVSQLVPATSFTATNRADADLLLKKANEAISNGASRAAVLKWLESKGVKVEE